MVQSQAKATTMAPIINNTQNSAELVLPMDIIHQVFEGFDDEWVKITNFASTWKRLQTDIDPRSYGCKNFPELVKKYENIFDYELREMKDDSGQRHMYVRLKK